MNCDIADRAEQQIEDFRDDAINEIRNAQAEQATHESAYFCEDCDRLIPEARRAAIKGVTRCVACQTIFERQHK